MKHHVKLVSKAPWVARGTWAFIMLLAAIFASHWGVAVAQVGTLLLISGVYLGMVAIAYYQLRQKHLTPTMLFIGFVLDLWVWSLFLYYSGGASNPLITLFLTIVAVASVVLTTPYILALSISSIIAYVLLWNFHEPLMMHHGHMTSEKLHLLGMFGVFVFALMMLSALTVYFKSAMKYSYQALAQAEQAIHQQRRVLAVSSFAANVAHEMSTPIASIQLLTDDIKSQLDDDDELLENIQLLQSQIQVCRQSLERLKAHIQTSSRHGDKPSPAPSLSWLNELLPKLVADWRFIHPHIQVSLSDFAAPICAMINAEQLYSIIINLLNNAMQAEAQHIWIDCVSAQDVMIIIKDDGIGIEPTQISHINNQQPIKSEHGWGVGLLLAKTILDYIDGDLQIAPIYHEGQPTGTQVTIYLTPYHPQEHTS